MKMVSDYLRKIAGQIEETGKKAKLHIEGIKIFFKAPDPRHPSTEEALTKEKEKFTEANFQWVAYQVLFTVEPDKENYYVYSTPLESNGDAKEPAIVFDSDSAWSGAHKNTPSNNYTPGDVVRSFPQLLKGPLLPKEGSGPEKFGQVLYIGAKKSDIGKRPYSSSEFKRLFDNDFYVVLDSATKELRNPFGKTIGIKH